MWEILGLIVFVVYIIGFTIALFISSQSPVTMGLSVLRALCWPVWFIVGEEWPRGRSLPMD